MDLIQPQFFGHWEVAQALIVEQFGQEDKGLGWPGPIWHFAESMIRACLARLGDSLLFAMSSEIEFVFFVPVGSLVDLALQIELG